jgi:hypothetical protein
MEAAEAQIRYGRMTLADAIVECQRLRAVLTAIVDEPQTWKMRKIAREALEQ